VTAITTPAKNPLMRKSIRISSTLVMVSPLIGERHGDASAAFLQLFVGDGVRPVLRRKIKSNRIGVLLHSPSRGVSRGISRPTPECLARTAPDGLKVAGPFLNASDGDGPNRC